MMLGDKNKPPRPNGLSRGVVLLNTLRIEESKNLLTSGEKISIEEVGIRVGIPQSYNFSRWFKAITEMTPYQYRKLNYKVTK